MRDTGGSELHEGLGENGVSLPVYNEKEKARRRLLELLKPGDTVYTTVRHVSRSGMTRYIDAYVFRNEEPVYLSGYFSSLLGWKMGNRYSGVKVEGCGMDMGFHLVYSVSYVLYGSGYECIQDNTKGINCPSNYHVNSHDWEKFDGLHTDGYALNQRWL